MVTSIATGLSLSRCGTRTSPGRVLSSSPLLLLGLELWKPHLPPPPLLLPGLPRRHRHFAVHRRLRDRHDLRRGLGFLFACFSALWLGSSRPNRCRGLKGMCKHCCMSDTPTPFVLISCCTGCFSFHRVSGECPKFRRKAARFWALCCSVKQGWLSGLVPTYRTPPRPKTPRNV